MQSLKISDLFDLSHATFSRALLEKYIYPWEVLGEIHNFILSYASYALPFDEYDLVGENVWIHDSAEIAKTAEINGPCIIGKNVSIRPGAFIRGNVIVGNGVVVGNSTELKNCILFDDVQVPHYNYVGDSILGYKAHMGAGAITSNIKADKKNIIIKTGDSNIETGLRKMGAMLGDFTDVGCNSVLNPGTIIGRNTNIYPLSMVRGVVPENSIFKKQDNIVIKR